MTENSVILFCYQNEDFAFKNSALTLFHPYFLKNHPFSPLKSQTFTPKGCSGKVSLYDKI